MRRKTKPKGWVRWAIVNRDGGLVEGNDGSPLMWREHEEEGAREDVRVDWGEEVIRVHVVPEPRRKK